MGRLVGKSWKLMAGLAVLLTLSAAVGLLLPQQAEADNTVCDGAIRLVPDGSEAAGTFTAPSQGRYFKFVGKSFRSYAVMLENTSPTDVQPTVSTGSILTGSCLGSPIGATGTVLSEPVPWDGSTGSGRWSIKLASDTQVFFNISTGSTPGSFRVRVVDTTQFNPLWSTFGGFETFYRFQNATNQALSVTLRLVNDAGTAVVNTTFTVPANSTAPTRNTGPGDLNLADDQAGQAIITHDGTPGALQVDGFLGIFTTSTPIVLPVKIVAARPDR